MSMNATQTRRAALALLHHAGIQTGRRIDPREPKLCAADLRAAGYRGRCHIALANRALEAVGVDHG
jgi:hypothetical protein